MLTKNLPFTLLVTIVVSVFLNSFIPYNVKCVIYALSLTIKSVVLFILPFIIFGLLFSTFVKLSDHAFSVFFLIFGTLCISNFLNTFISQNIGAILYGVDFNLDYISNNKDSLKPYFLLLIPSPIKNEIALLGGILSSLAVCTHNKKLATLLSQKIDIIVFKLFSIISPLIPIFIIGYMIKCASEGRLTIILKNYSQILSIFFIYAAAYTFLLYLIVNKLVLKNCLLCLRHMIPALITAVSTMSSSSTMPITIASVSKFVKNKVLASSVISATVNIHLLGDCLFIPTLAYAILKNYGFDEPSLYSYFIFTIFFIISKFSVAAIPAGGIIVMTPVLEKYLGFTPEMSTLIIAIYVAFDPIITGFNVLGNGALAKLIDNIVLNRKITSNPPIL